ncbi:MAG: thiamine phosphate synthase, partial [Verrucomicrobia bacterium]|nr:thiamine phosphate synthase [Verrucomicrobiota bacterium]
MLRFVKELFASKPEAPAPANLVLISPNGKYVEGRAMLKVTRALLDAGLARFHLREYDWSDAQHLEFIDALPKAYWPRIVLHGRPELALARPLGGVHLRAGERRHRAWPKELALSCSCHSYDELQQTAGPCAYALLSPLFPSVSKSGYQPQRTTLELAAIRSHWRAQGGCPVYALG